jgi:enoyl-CoA hydratase/carnithine racemase
MSIEFDVQNHIAFFTINYPQYMNALDAAALIKLNTAVKEFNDDSGLRAGIISGSGSKSFCTGFNLKTSGTSSDSGKPETQDINFLKGFNTNKPLIAAINGAALGGGLELALMCDIRIAASHAAFGMPEVLHGLMPGWGGTQRLPRQISKCRAAELIFTGKTIDAAEAYRIGLINYVVNAEELMETAVSEAELICRAAPLAVQAAKEAMNRGSEVSLEDGLSIEQALLLYLQGTEDFKEGIRAFRQKRAPEYRGS